MSTVEMTQARSRIVSLVDEGSFVEIGSRITARATDFDLQEKTAPGDGVITGYASIGGKLVYVYSQDASVLGGSIGEMHAGKIVRLYEMALKMGCPVIGLADSAGLRLQEVTDALNGFGSLHKIQAKASGVIPEILAVFGKCGGGMAVCAGLSDFVYMEEQKAELFVNAPNTIDGNSAEKCDTASASWQAAHSGLVDGVGSEPEILAEIRALVEILPANNEDNAVSEGLDDLNRLTESLEGVTDVRAIAETVADQYLFVETKRDFAKEVLTGFARLDGVTVGIAGNREEKFSADGCRKLAGFVRFCDAFDIPVITLTAVTGFASDIEEEKKMTAAASELTYAFANATVPKINVILKGFGTAYILMNSRALGADIVYAEENAKIGMMDAGMAAKILSKDPAGLRETAAAFDEKQSARAAASRGYVDEIVSMTTLRKNLLTALEMLFNKREDAPYKKHGTK